MVQISRRKLSDELLEKLFALLFEVVGKKGNKDEFDKIIRDVLSPVERIMIAKRIAVIYLLSKDISYTAICQVLKVSPATVAKFHFQMERSDGVVSALKKILRNEKMARVLEEIFLELSGPGTYGTDWKAGWKEKLDSERRKQLGI